ncbi:MAG: hypothetical protein ACI4AD_01825 [Roseburia sp.]
MSKIKVAVCDADEGYRRRFVTYLMEHRREELEVYAFSLPALLLQELETTVFGVVLLGEGFEEAIPKVQERKIPLLVLAEEVPMRVAETSDFGQAEQTLTSRVFKYQPMDHIMHEMQVLTGGSALKPKSECAMLPGMEVIGVYSPVKHEMQMAFSAIFAAIMAEKRKVLYINLMEHSGFLELFGLTGEYDLGDIVIRIRKNRLLPEIFLRSVYEMGEVSYIPPFRNPEDLLEFKWEDYQALLKFLEEKTPFEMVIIDFGQGLDCFPQMLSTCSSVYCPVKTGYFYECRKEQFLNYVRTATGEALEEKLHFAELPFSTKAIHGGTKVFEQLMWSEFGDYIREYLTGGIV